MIKRQAIDQDQFYSILEGLRQASLEELGDSERALHRPHSSAEELDPAEIAFGSQQDQTSTSRYQLEQDRLRAIEEAEERLATGCYGICIGCGNDIAIARLLAEPTAVRCVSCQSVSEKRESAALLA
jgi:DnaK suppressor protein